MSLLFRDRYTTISHLSNLSLLLLHIHQIKFVLVNKDKSFKAESTFLFMRETEVWRDSLKNIATSAKCATLSFRRIEAFGFVENSLSISSNWIARFLKALRSPAKGTTPLWYQFSRLNPQLVQHLVSTKSAFFNASILEKGLLMEQRHSHKATLYG